MCAVNILPPALGFIVFYLYKNIAQRYTRNEDIIDMHSAFDKIERGKLMQELEKLLQEENM